eukprot:9468667-Pyramimonas_sp.AAC.1
MTLDIGADWRSVRPQGPLAFHRHFSTRLGNKCSVPSTSSTKLGDGDMHHNGVSPQSCLS